ncbi:MAG TPA: hypothetical protein VFR99_00195 [Marmoricola sp.]|nr:hypothetical protein [Marmoricola sp.]
MGTLGDSEAQLGHVREIDVADVDATQYFAIGVDDDEVQGGAPLVLAYPIGQAVIEVVEVIVTAVTDSRGEEGPVGPVRQAEAHSPPATRRQAPVT